MFAQLIDKPTRNSGRTIDLCFVPADMKDNFQVTQHSPYYSDHDAILVSLDIQVNNSCILIGFRLYDEFRSLAMRRNLSGMRKITSGG